MDAKPSLRTVLRHLKLSGLLATLPERGAYAEKSRLSYHNFLELVLTDEVERREQASLRRRLIRAQFQEE